MRDFVIQPVNNDYGRLYAIDKVKVSFIEDFFSENILNTIIRQLSKGYTMAVLYNLFLNTIMLYSVFTLVFSGFLKFLCKLYARLSDFKRSLFKLWLVFLSVRRYAQRNRFLY